MSLAQNFARHGREHISASQIAKFVSSPAAWVETYLENQHRAVGLRAYEGKCIETALNLSFDKIDSESDVDNIDLQMLQHDVQVEAEKEFQATMVNLDSLIENSQPLDLRREKVPLDEMYSEKNRAASLERICKKVEVGIPACIELYKTHGGKPESQVEIYLTIPLDKKSEIRVLGYIDWLFPDGHVVDLKTTRNIPTALSMSHGFQAYVYMVSQQLDTMEFLFIGDRKREPVSSLFAYRDDKFRENVFIFQDAAQRLGKMLRLSKKTLTEILPKNPESYYFNSPVITGLERN